MRRWQLVTAAALIGIAAVAMFDTRNGALPDTTGGAPGGLTGGWYPFWSAALAALTLGIVVYRTARGPAGAPTLYADRESAMNVVRLAVPMLVLVVLMDKLLGFYIAGGLYLAYFGRVVGGYRWPWAIAPAVLIPVLLYVVFEQFFHVALPKSILYVRGFPL